MNENGTLKLNRSWKVKSFTKGLELFKLVGNVAEAEGMYALVAGGSHCCLIYEMTMFNYLLEILSFLPSRVTVYANAGHHPDLHLVGWNNITIEIWTHAVGENFVSNHMASLFKVIFLYIYVQVTIPMPSTLSSLKLCSENTFLCPFVVKKCSIYTSFSTVLLLRWFSNNVSHEIK